MPDFSKLPIIHQDDFQIILPENSVIRKNQKHSIIIFENHIFKQLDEQTNLSLKALNPTIEKAFICHHSHSRCRCRFFLLSDGNGKIMNDHIVDFAHAVDAQDCQRIDLRCSSPLNLIPTHQRQVNNC